MAQQQASNVKNIMRAVEQLALATQAHVQSVLTPFTGSKLFAAPTEEQLQQAGTPFLAINRPRLLGYAPGGGPTIDPEAAHGIQITEPVWDIEVFTFHPYDPSYPNYDDALDDINALFQTFQQYPALPYATTVQASPAPTTTTFAVSAGDGKRFMPSFPIFLNGVFIGIILSIAGDVITLGTVQPTPPAAGAIASQGTCGNSFSHDSMPDYAELVNGGPWCVGYTVVRVFEQLNTQFP